MTISGTPISDLAPLAGPTPVPERVLRALQAKAAGGDGPRREGKTVIFAIEWMRRYNSAMLISPTTVTSAITQGRVSPLQR